MFAFCFYNSSYCGLIFLSSNSYLSAFLSETPQLETIGFPKISNPSTILSSPNVRNISTICLAFNRQPPALEEMEEKETRESNLQSLSFYFTPNPWPFTFKSQLFEGKWCCLLDSLLYCIYLEYI